MLLTDMCDVEAAYLLLIMCGGYEVNMALTLVVIRPVAVARSCYILPSEYILSPPPPEEWWRRTFGVERCWFGVGVSAFKTTSKFFSLIPA